MKLSNHSARTDKQVFDQYSSGEDYGFTKTVVPVRLAQYGEDKLISRSQARRLLARIDRFRSVLFDFKAVETIGQAFADEIFRVFAQGHPEIEIIAINATVQVQQMINAARVQLAALDQRTTRPVSIPARHEGPGAGGSQAPRGAEPRAGGRGPAGRVAIAGA